MLDQISNNLRFDKGVMRLSAFDPQSKQYETRILTLPELPLLESLENMFDNNDDRVALRMTKSCCNNKKSTNHGTNNTKSHPRRCQSHPNLSTKQQQQEQQPRQKKSSVFVSSIRSKILLASAFQAVAGLFQKGTNHSEKMSLQQRQNLTCDNWWMASPPISSC